MSRCTALHCTALNRCRSCTALQVGQEGVAGLAEVEEAAVRALAGDVPSDCGVDVMEMAAVVPGIKDHKSDLVNAGVRLKLFMVGHSGVKDVLTMATIATANFAYDNLNKVGASAVIVKISVTRKGRALTGPTFLAPAKGWRPLAT